MNKSVIIVGNDWGWREQLVKVFETTRIVCVDACASAEEALPNIMEKRPDVVLVDINLPGMSGIECLVKVKRNIPSIHVVIFTVFDDSERIFCALRAGADGYILKTDSPQLWLNAIYDVCEGGAPMSRSIARKVANYFHLIGISISKPDKLSARQQEILCLLTQGFNYKEIGDQLKIVPETVRTHVKVICRKMGVDNRMKAVAQYYQSKSGTPFCHAS